MVAPLGFEPNSVGREPTILCQLDDGAMWTAATGPGARGHDGSQPFRPKSLVLPGGFEPPTSRLRTWRPRPLDDGSILGRHVVSECDGTSSFLDRQVAQPACNGITSSLMDVGRPDGIRTRMNLLGLRLERAGCSPVTPRGDAGDPEGNRTPDLMVESHPCSPLHHGVIWCPRGESNPHGRLAHWLLGPACMPIPARGRLVDPTGVEPATSSLPRRRAPSYTSGPSGAHRGSRTPTALSTGHWCLGPAPVPIRVGGRDVDRIVERLGLCSLS